MRLLILSLITAISLLFPLSSPDAKPEARDRPKLIVVLVIDQFRYDYLVRFRPQFVERGFNLLLGGANFVNCRYEYATTITGPGHATLFTGAYPNIHGIIGNGWYDRSRGRTVSCIEDSTARLVGSGNPRGGLGVSPRNLIGSTLGDELRLASDFRSKVVAVSLKDRAAVLSGGHTANAAYWYDAGTGHFVTSSYYMSALPSWVAEVNERTPAKPYCGKAWQALAETPGAGSKLFNEFRLASGETCPDQKFLAWIDNTPFMNEIELSFAREAIKNEHLGQGPTTDLLIVGLSVNDYIGHAYGPYSLEVADLTLRTDRYLADFFNDLDRVVGLDNVWIALSADHGVAPAPRFIKEHHLGAGNVQIGGIKSIVEQTLSQTFGQDHWVEDFSEFYIYLSQAALKRHEVDPVRAEVAAAQAAASAPGVAAAFTRTQLLTGNLGASPLAHEASNSFNSQRSGDVFMVLDPFAMPIQGETETTHGSPWNYDSQVPVVLWGSAFRPGTYAIPCQTIDLAPTLGAALGISQPSGAQGQPLTPALK